MAKKNQAPVCPYRLIAEARLPSVEGGLGNQIQVTRNVETGAYSFTHHLDYETTETLCKHLKDALRKFSKALEAHYGPYSGR
jgi:glutamine synthetase